VDELYKLVEQSNLFPPNPHPLIAELLPFVVVFQAAVLTVRILRTSGGRDAALQVVEMNFVTPILASMWVLVATLILAFILFASRAAPSAWLEILLTARPPETFTLAEVFANMPHVHRLTIFLIMVAPSFLSLWNSGFTRLAAVFAAQLLFYSTFSKLADMRMDDVFINLLLYVPEGLATTIALTVVFLSRYALPWVVGSMVAIPLCAALKAFRRGKSTT